MNFERKHSPLVALLVAQLAWLVAARTALHVGWGFGAAPLPDGTVAPGWMGNLTDNLGYATFLQQARWDSSLGASLLYTTTPHAAAYFNPLLWGLGRLASATGTRPEGWLIVIGLGAALACTGGIYRLGLGISGRSTAFFAAAISAFGSGWTWVQRLVAKALGWDHYNAADVRFMDLLPSSAALFYPLHTVGIALMAWILVLLFQLESGAPDLSRRGREGLLVLLALLLSWIRPYEPAVLLAVYGIYTGSGWIARDPRARSRVRGMTLLLVACGPGLAHAGWLATQPVWDILSSTSLSWGHERRFWLQGFGGLWLAGAAGAWLGRRLPGPARLALIWYLAAALLLLGFNINQTKLLSGCGLALALLSGHALASAWLRWRPRWHPAVAGLVATLVAGVAVGPGSLGVALRESTLARPGIDTGLWRIAARLREDRPFGIPTVLTEIEAGGILPGIAGVRVWAGHWILTDQRPAKEARLREAGLEPDSPGGEPGRTLNALRTLLDQSGADYLLLRKDVPAAAVLSALPALHPLAAQDGWLLYASVQIAR